ncbi:MAG: hypothetical protein ACRC8Z_14190 [Empedobacter falsenii]
MSTIINNALYLVGSIFTSAFTVFSSKPVYDREFVQSLKDEDKLQIDQMIRDSKIKKGEPTEITLSDKSKITIMVK